jgi:hypothetical protein
MTTLPKATRTVDGIIYEAVTATDQKSVIGRVIDDSQILAFQTFPADTDPQDALDTLIEEYLV